MKQKNLIILTNNYLNQYYNIAYLYHNFTFFNNNIYNDDIIYIAYLINKNIIGLLNIEYNKKENIYLFNYIEVIKKYRNQKIATKMIQLLEIFLKSYKCKLKISPYTSDGEKYLKHKLKTFIELEKDLSPTRQNNNA